eukprot:8573330-Pyramimonas_sp.AAC.1
MAGAVDPAAAAPEGCASDYPDALSTVADVTDDADTPIEYIVVEDMDLPPKRWVVFRAGAEGRVKTRIEMRLSAEEYNLTVREKATIGNTALRKPDGVDLNPGRGPVRYGPWIPPGATPTAPPSKPKANPPIDISPSWDSSSQPKPLGPDQLRPPPKQKKGKSPDDPPILDITSSNDLRGNPLID